MPAQPPRPSLGFGDALDGLNGDWSVPEVKPKAFRPAPETARKAAAVAGFRSREPAPTPAASAPLGRPRTGRTEQLNLRASPETIAAFARVANAKGWTLGETFERAVALLEDVG